MSLNKVTSADLDLNSKTKAVLLFGATWHNGIPPLEAVLKALASAQKSIFFGTVDAEEVTALTEKHNVTSVPTVIFLNEGETVERLDGSVEPAQITVAVQRLLKATKNTAAAGASTSTVSSTPTLSPEEVLNKRLDQLIKMDKVVLFMKGVPTAPRCGFSRQAVELLSEQKIPFGSFDILSDEDVRQGLKKYSNWPTYPQIYVNGELQGGLDILKELVEEGSLAEQWEIKASEVPESLDDRLAKLVKRSDVMLFMKGLPSAPKCGFSRQIVELLDESGVAYDAFDILQDEEVRQGLKKFSDWPTFPQLYVKGDLIGGLDICKELHETGEFADALQQ